MTTTPERRATDEPLRPEQSPEAYLTERGWKNIMSVYWLEPGTVTPSLRVDLAVERARRLETEELLKEES